jgi:hypothetical protein
MRRSPDRRARSAATATRSSDARRSERDNVETAASEFLRMTARTKAQVGRKLMRRICTNARANVRFERRWLRSHCIAWGPGRCPGGMPPGVGRLLRPGGRARATDPRGGAPSSGKMALCASGAALRTCFSRLP